MKRYKPAELYTILFLLPVLLLLNSCFGVNADIILNQNGSGTINLEYRIAKSVDLLGRLDGNERWNTIPVGRADFERTLDRLPEMKLLSFSSREDAKDLIISARMEFSSIQGLLAFFDASGQRSSFSGNALSGSLSLTLSEGRQNNNASLDHLIAAVTSPYTVVLGMTFPVSGNLAVQDTQGRNLGTIPGAVIVTTGKKVSCSVPLYQVLSSNTGFNLIFRW